MRRHSIFIDRAVLTAISALCFLLSANGQEKLKFDSVFQPLTGLQGNARYEYFLNESDFPIKDGPFWFSATERDSVSTMTVRKREWTGTYSNDQRVKDWTFETIEHRVNLSDVDDDFKPVVNTISERSLIRGDYENGLPSGKWTLQQTSFLNGEKTFHPLDAQFTTLKKAKSDSTVSWFRIEENADTTKFKGQTENGLMIGTWLFQYTNGDRSVSESRTYDRGILLYLTKVNRMTGDTLVHLNYPFSNSLQQYLSDGKSDKELARVPLAVQFSDGYPRNSALITEQEAADELMIQMMREMFHFDPNLFSENGLVFGTDRMIYPLSANEKKILKSWSETVDGLRSTLEDIAALINENPPEGRLALRSAKAWMAEQQHILEHIAPWKRILENDEVQFYNRNGLLSEYVLNLLRDDTLVVEPADTFIVNYHRSDELNDNFLLYAHQNFLQRSDVADSILSTYAETIARIELEESVNTSTAIIREKMQELRERYETAPEGPQQLKELHTVVRSRVVQKEMPARFWKIQNLDGDTEAQKLAVDSMLVFLENTHELKEAILEVFDSRKRLDSLYTEYVFDPYTYNDRFPKRLKRKLYETVAERLFAALFEEALKKEQLDDIAETVGLISKSQRKLASMIDKDTRKLEQKMNRSLSKEEILGLLEIR